MSEECGQNCAGCEADCGERKMDFSEFREAPNDMSQIKKVIGVVSGKGGVGKTLVTSLLAVAASRAGHSAAILDADITGPSIPQAFGVHGKALGDENGIYPAETPGGVKLMSINLLLDDETDPVVWRGPVIAGTVKQFWTDVVWGGVDYMFVDLPPGTGDVPLTVFQSLPLDGIVIVTTPQQLVGMIVGKAVKMAQMMGVPILGLVENMSYVPCPDCGKQIPVFGQSRLADAAKEYGITTTDALPIDPTLATLCDAGKIEEYQGALPENVVKSVLGL